MKQGLISTSLKDRNGLQWAVPHHNINEKPLFFYQRDAVNLIDEIFVVLFEAFDVNFEARQFELQRVVEGFQFLILRQQCVVLGQWAVGSRLTLTFAPRWSQAASSAKPGRTLTLTTSGQWPVGQL